MLFQSLLDGNARPDFEHFLQQHGFAAQQVDLFAIDRRKARLGLKRHIA